MVSVGEPAPREVVRAQYLASAAGDLTALTALLAPDVEWTEMAGFPYAGTFVGPEAVAANVFARIGRDWEGWRAHDDEYVTEGERVIVLGRYTAVHAASRRAMSVRVVHSWVVRGGRIVRFEQFVDTAQVKAAMQ